MTSIPPNCDVPSKEDIFNMIGGGELDIPRALALMRDYASELTTSPLEIEEMASVPDLPSIMSELNSLIGLNKVKKLVHELYAYVAIQQRRKQKGLHSDPLVLHMIFKGNPGTGKTTVARLLGLILYRLQVLPKGHLVEVERADLVGEYIGHTAQKTREQLKKAMGGILFIDEAYSLGRGGEKDFGKEAIDTIVKAMEDHKDNIIIILAGYKREMENFLRLNPGLKSRFPIRMKFEDYCLDELLDIAKMMLSKRDYRLSQDAHTELESLLTIKRQSSPMNFGNARLVRNIIEQAMRMQAVRLIGEDANTREQLMTIEAEDIRHGKGDAL